MLLSFIYLILLAFYIPIAIYLLIQNFSYALLILQISGFIAIARSAVQEISKKYLPLYFFIERRKLFFVSDTTSKWWFQGRYDGISSKEVFNDLEINLRKDSRFKIKILKQNDREKELEINETLFITLTFVDESESPFGLSHIDVVSRTIEVSYGHAKKKLENQIEPFLLSLANIIKPEKHSFELNVDFMGKSNPFFNVYIANLSPSQVEDFRVVLHVDGNSPNSLSDKVVISSNSLHITADSTNSFRKLAENFILLTPDTRILIGDKNG
jgi:hypothetical protein